MAWQVGPIEYRQLPNARSVRLYVVRHDKGSTCETPRTLQHLWDELEAEFRDTAGGFRSILGAVSAGHLARVAP